MNNLPGLYILGQCLLIYLFYLHQIFIFPVFYCPYYRWIRVKLSFKMHGVAFLLFDILGGGPKTF